MRCMDVEHSRLVLRISYWGIHWVGAALEF
jgi:hypothetical protein